MKITIILMLILSFLFTGCSKTEENEDASSVQSIVFEKISSEKAKELMDALSSDDYIILDVRTTNEYNDGHIKDAVLIPLNELAERAEEELTDKAKAIFIYCRSGNRSASAAKTLEELGYTNLYDFGGINDWPYEVIK